MLSSTMNLAEWIAAIVLYGFALFFLIVLIVEFANSIIKSSKKKAGYNKDIDVLQMSVGCPGKQFVVDKKLRTNIENRSNIEADLQELMCQFLEHMQINGENVQLFIVHSQFSRATGAGRGGAYYKSYNETNQIEIIIKKEYEFYDIAAILAHECSHYFLDYYKVNDAINGDSELFTDITAIFLGFGHILQKGYAPKAGRTGILQQAEYFSLGYLDYLEVETVRRLCKGRRRNWWFFVAKEKRRHKRIEKQQRAVAEKQEKIQQKAQQEKQRIQEEQRKIKELHVLAVELYRAVFEQIVNEPGKDCYKQEDIESIQAYYYEKETRQMQVKLRKIENEIALPHEETLLEGYTQEINEICQQLSVWKYLLEK